MERKKTNRERERSVDRAKASGQQNFKLDAFGRRLLSPETLHPRLRLLKA